MRMHWLPNKAARVVWVSPVRLFQRDDIDGIVPVFAWGTGAKLYQAGFLRSFVCCAPGSKIEQQTKYVDVCNTGLSDAGSTPAVSTIFFFQL